MKQYRVIVTPFAGENIREAYAWFQLENPSYAARWLQGMEEKIQQLEFFPESHPLAPENAAFEPEIRHMLYGRGTPWRIFLTIQESVVYVLHVRHGRRDAWGS